MAWVDVSVDPILFMFRGKIAAILYMVEDLALPASTFGWKIMLPFVWPIRADQMDLSPLMAAAVNWRARSPVQDQES